jgi:hypothetical protein
MLTFDKLSHLTHEASLLGRSIIYIQLAEA